MIICVDVGNTNIVVAIVNNDVILSTYRFITNDALTEDDYYQKMKAVIPHEKISGAIISSVVPSLDNVLEELFVKYYSVKPLFVGPGIKSGIKIKIEEPKSLGADLLCDCVGAVNKFGYPVAVVDLGTATKVLIVNEKNEFLGGAIAPGMNGSLNSLISSAAKLSKTALKKPKKVIGSDTISCIQSGMIYGYAAMIDGLIARMIEELQINNLKVVLTGGLSILIKDVVKTKVSYEPNILIEGLIQIYKKNQFTE